MPKSISEAALLRAKLAIRLRRRRDGLFGSTLFAEPGWDMLLHLFVQCAAGLPVTVLDACDASSCPHTTALRHLATLVNKGLIDRQPDPIDRRKVILRLTDLGVAKMEGSLTDDEKA